MDGRFGSDKIAEIRERASIVEVVSRHVALRRAGQNHVGLCPFHSEKTPSFSVREDRGFFHCFGCGESGDVFKFLMRRENLTFPEALEQLARETGVELPKRGGDARRDEARERFHRVNAAAADYFQRCLWDERIGRVARAYLTEREINEQTARAFALGYAPPEGLAHALEKAGLALREAEVLGLVGRSRRGPGWYDRFRQRLMFAIHDLSGKIVGFGGRALGESTTGGPKYLNSPESPLYHKGRLLFGLAAAREAIRAAERAIVVEGYMDAISLAQAGIRNVVAPLGTSLTSDQVRTLRRFADAIVVFFDGDAAGARAAARSFAVFAEVGVFADAAFLPPGEDPDTFVRRHGRAGIEARIAERSPLVDHYLATLAAPGASLPERKRAAETVADLLGRIGDPIFAGLLARRGSEHLGIAETQLLARTRRLPPPPAPRTPPPSASRPPPARAIAIPPHESLVLELLVLFPRLTAELPDDSGAILSSSEVRAILARIRELGSMLHPADVVDELPEDSRARIARALSDDERRSELYPEPERMLAECFARLRGRRADERLRSLGDEIRAAESRGDTAAVEALLAEKQRLSTERAR
jgi:DNA primase